MSQKSENLADRCFDAINHAFDVIEGNVVGLWVEANLAFNEMPSLTYEDFQVALNTPDDVFF